ncbi:hypothetical protein Micbo1qcDRAFT_163309 [Microdochium bolleyi]|uniref:HMG box domain-containing protein n=1 Tax=Microdochium bolleyi TaxID=196109 RepID=A0A136J302_9PEZI|nr:hypothetical protein Micbo1qcDRAFT_163309 [Microdochium bolleyi]
MPRPKKADVAAKAAAAAAAAQQAAPPPPPPVMPAMAPSPYTAPPPMPQQPLQPYGVQFPPATPQFGGAPPPMPVAPRTVDVEQFTRVRDSVHLRFNTILGLMKSFSDDFLRQTNLLLGESTPFDTASGNAMTAMVAGLDGLSGQLNELGGAPLEEEKKRKKRTHDPNAPKRPLTPYFLYMQTARPIIATDLGQDAPKGAVQEEGQRRWAAMSPADKVAWNNAYQFNLRLYNARVHSYKHGNPAAREMTDQDAHLYADQNDIAQPTLSSEDAAVPGNEQDAVNEQLGLAAAAVPAPVVPTPVSPEETKTPKPKAGGRKRKSTAADTAAEEGEASAAKVSTPANPEKKRKRQSKVAETPVEEPKKSARKKKST